MGFRDRPKRMCFGPKRPGCADSVDAGFTPPQNFVTGPVHFAMMAAAQRDDKFVTHFAAQRRVLRKPKVMCVRRPSPTNQTWLRGDEFAVGLVPKPTRLR